MNYSWINELKTLALAYAVPFAGRLVGAIALWIIGRIVINAVKRATRRHFERRDLDATLVRYINSVLGVVLNIVLVLAVLSVFGVETTSFAGILAAAGVAIGMAWSGLLSNFAAGVFLIVLRPFHVGNTISAGGVTGEVKEIGLFVTTIDSGDNIRNFVGNSKIFSDNIQNYSLNPHRRVMIKVQIAHSVNVAEAILRIRERIARVPHVLDTPGPSVDIVELGAAGPVLMVATSTDPGHYGAVHSEMFNAVQQELKDAGYPVPEYPVAPTHARG